MKELYPLSFLLGMFGEAKQQCTHAQWGQPARPKTCMACMEVLTWSMAHPEATAAAEIDVRKVFPPSPKRAEKEKKRVVFDDAIEYYSIFLSPRLIEQAIRKQTRYCFSINNKDNILLFFHYRLAIL